MTGMSQGDAQELRKRLEIVFPDVTAQLESCPDAPGLFRVNLYRRATGERLASFYNLPFGNRVIGRTPEPQAKEAR